MYTPQVSAANSTEVRGEQLKLEVADTNLLNVSTIIPLNRFASARKAAPAQTFTQDVDE